MSKIVTKFRYYKPKSREKKGGYAKYIATRDGVEKINNTPPNSPTTLSQQALIKQLLLDFPDSVEMLEYADYLADPTVAKASEFITRAIEDNAQEVVNRTTYADYIATRPRAERLGNHGLFSDAREEVNLNQVSETLNEHQGNMWTMIVSLRREDAERLNYNSAEAWRTLMQKHAADLADALKIPFSDLKWYGAFHNESHHPHIHVIAYTDDEKVGYLSKYGVEKMRSVLGQSIFGEELKEAYEKQTEKRNLLKREWKKMLDEICAHVENGTYDNLEIAEKLERLSDMLSRTKGKKVYGYLRKDIKNLIDSIVDSLADSPEIKDLYDLWWKCKCDILETYTSEMPPKFPLSKNKEFKSIKNDIIREALGLLSCENNSLFDVDSRKEQKNNRSKSSRGSAQSNHNYQPQHSKVSAVAVTRLFKNMANIMRDRIDQMNRGKNPIRLIDKRQRQEIEDKKNAELTMT